MEPTFKTYYYIPYEFGWMVRSKDSEGNDVMDMCYSTEEDAKSHTEKANEREPKRFAESMKNYERMLANIHYEGIENFYGVRGRYYGD